MNAKQLLAIALFAATGSVFAQSAEFTAPDAGFASTKTRAEVRAELSQAYTDGVLAQRDGADTVIAAGTRSRADVRAEAVQSAHNQRNNVKDVFFGG